MNLVSGKKGAGQWQRRPRQPRGRSAGPFPSRGRVEAHQSSQKVKPPLENAAGGSGERY